jgi:hypothetical protein
MMNEWEGAGDLMPEGCAEVQLVLPEHLSGALSDSERASVASHLSVCVDCAASYSFLQVLRPAAPSPPADLAARIVARALMDPNGLSRDLPHGGLSTDVRTRLRWGGVGRVAAAATVILALGAGWMSLGRSGESAGLAWADAFDIPTESWGMEDWYVAGAPYLDGISDATLAALMEEVDR